jgi:phasin family protein
MHPYTNNTRRNTMGLYPTPEDLSAAQKQNIEAMMKLSQKAFEGIEKMVELQLNAARASLQETADKFQAQDVVSLNKDIATPNAEKALAYSRTIYDIASQTSSEFHRLVDAQIADANKKLIDALDDFSRSAPAGSEGVVAMMKSSLTAASSAYETANKAARQVVEMAERNMRSAAEAGLNASKR